MSLFRYRSKPFHAIQFKEEVLELIDGSIIHQFNYDAVSRFVGEDICLHMEGTEPYLDIPALSLECNVDGHISYSHYVRLRDWIVEDENANGVKFSIMDNETFKEMCEPLPESLDNQQ